MYIDIHIGHILFEHKEQHNISTKIVHFLKNLLSDLTFCVVKCNTINNKLDLVSI